MVIYYIRLYKQNIMMVILYNIQNITNRISDGHIYITYTYNTNRIYDGHIILHTLITQTEYAHIILMVILSDGHIILHTLITQTEYLMVIL